MSICFTSRVQGTQKNYCMKLFFQNIALFALLVSWQFVGQESASAASVVGTAGMVGAAGVVGAASSVDAAGVVGAASSVDADANSDESNTAQQDASSPNKANAEKASAVPAKYAVKKPIITRNQERALFFTDATIQSNERYHSVLMLWGHLDFYGEADEIIVIGGSIHLYPGSRVRKSLITVLSPFQKDALAKITGDKIIFDLPASYPRWMNWLAHSLAIFVVGGDYIISFLSKVFVAWVFGLIFIYLCPKFLEESKSIMEIQPVKSTFWAFIALLTFSPIVVLLVVSIVGILFLPLYVMLYWLIYYAGAVVSAVVVGDLIMKFIEIYVRNGKSIPDKWNTKQIHLLIGVMLFLVLGFLPFIGIVLVIFTSFIGWGAVTYTLIERYRKGRA